MLTQGYLGFVAKLCWHNNGGRAWQNQTTDSLAVKQRGSYFCNPNPLHASLLSCKIIKIGTGDIEKHTPGLYARPTTMLVNDLSACLEV